MAQLQKSIVRIDNQTEVPQWVRLQLDLRKWMSGWIDDLVKRHQTLPWSNLHDEGIFTRTLPAYYLISGQLSALEFSEMLADQFLESNVAEACTCFLTKEDAEEYGENPLVEKHHGYQADQSCLVHGPENYCWFLAHLAHISDKKRYRHSLADCAEHIGNFCNDCPPWYDWENSRFRSAILGTKKVRDYPPYDYETLTHVRVMVLATNNYALTGDKRYLDLATNWADKWADVVINSGTDGFPVALYPIEQDKVAEVYGEFANFSRTKANAELMNLFLDLYRINSNDRYLEAVRKQLAAVIHENDWAIGSLLMKYRTLSGDNSFDDTVVELADKSLYSENETPGLLISINPPSESGFEGFDYVSINKDTSVIKDNRSVSMLTCAYAITGDNAYVESAMKLAWMRFWASWFLWDGREFGCRGSWTGRNGVALHNVLPALNLSAAGGFGMLEGELPWMEAYYRRIDGRPGLPEQVAALYRESADGTKVITFANINDSPRILFAAQGRNRVAIPDMEDEAAGWTRVDIPESSIVTVELK